MSTLVRNALILLFCLVFSLFAIYPPESKIRLGKDLAGGVSLVYNVEIGAADPPDTLSKAASNLKERLDPKGVLEISIVPIGTDRLEITMPLPSDRVKGLQANFEQTLQGVTTTTLTKDNLERIAVLSEPARSEELKKFAGGDATRLERLVKAASDFNAVREARAKYDASAAEIQVLQDKLRNAGGDVSVDPLAQGMRDALKVKNEERARLASDAAKVSLNYDASLASALAIGLSPGDLRRALSLSERDFRLRSKDGTVAVLDSPRKRAIAEIMAKYPDQKPAVEKAIASWNTYESQRKSLDDPEDVVRILRGSGVLDFRITVTPGELVNESELRNELREGGSRNVKFDDARFFKVNKIESWVESVEDLDALKQSPAAFFMRRGLIAEEYKGEYYVLCWDKRGLRLTKDDGDNWQVARSFPGSDQLGRPAIDFQMNPVGSEKLGELTGRNVGRQMAVLLDDQVYTAPTLQSKISTQGQISGNFSQPEIDYIVRVLNAGSMAAKISGPVSKSILGPSLGKENLDRGLFAGVVAFFVVAGFMILYYFSCGLISIIALVFNAILLVAAMSLNQAAFTLPGIAGVILTFGMAVDANVLIYERMREEIVHNGHDLRTAIRLSYSKALSAIVDGNVTTLIVCVVLGFTGTQEVRGFALTLGIGTVTTLFAQLFGTRFIFNLLIDKLHWRSASMLPMAMKWTLRPHIDWIGLRWTTLFVSIALTGLGVFFIVFQGKDLMGTEFRGGTAVTLALKEKHGADGKPILGPSGQPTREVMARSEVEGKVRALADDFVNDRNTREAFETAEILAINPEADGKTSSTFTIKTLIEDPKLVQDELIKAFKDKLDVFQAISFEGSTLAPERAPIFAISGPNLGAIIGRSGVTSNVTEFEGGAAILLDKLSPSVSKDEIESRFRSTRAKGQYAGASTRSYEVRVLSGSDSAVSSAVILVRDPEIRVDDRRRWETDLRNEEWEIVKVALTETQTLAEVQSFSSSIARTFKSQAITAVLLSTLLVVIYVWVRFNSFRYSLAAIATTLHDCLVAIGFVALATVIYNKMPGLAATLGILPFKIDLNVVAAVLTILGYSLNDTIIVLDRIRELRGKRPDASREIINDAINQTISRTIITAGTTFLATLVLYLIGGEGVRVFAYTMLVGIIVGTYSSIAVAAPLVWVRAADRKGGRPETSGGEGGGSVAKAA